MPGTRNLVIIGAVVVVCGLGAYGWMRKNDRPIENSLVTPGMTAPYSQAAQYPDVNPAYSAPPSNYNAGNYAQGNYNGSAAVPQPVYTTDGYYPSRMRPIYVRQQEIVQEQQPVIVQNSAPRRVYQEQEYYTDSRGHRRGRTKTHSVEIVAGTAAAGAVIGAIAGGGKGAAIGAASGGGAGFIYDRLTHNK